MPNFVIWSDLHIEFADFELPAPEAFPCPIDGVLIAGDIHTGRNLSHLYFAQKVCRTYGVPVVIVNGNHEYYGCEMNDLNSRQAEEVRRMNAGAASTGKACIHILSGEGVIIGGVRIIGATLWTDFDLDPAAGLRSRQFAAAGMNDFRLIGLDQGRGPARLSPDDTVQLHRTQIASILDQLSRSHPGPTIVMTHHMPIRQSIHRMYHLNPLNAAFASDLLEEIENLDFDAWIFGHSHQNTEFEYEIKGRTRRFLSNPRGYPQEATCFDPLRVLCV